MSNLQTRLRSLIIKNGLFKSIFPNHRIEHDRIERLVEQVMEDMRKSLKENIMKPWFPK